MSATPQRQLRARARCRSTRVRPFAVSPTAPDRVSCLQCAIFTGDAPRSDGRQPVPNRPRRQLTRRAESVSAHAPCHSRACGGYKLQFISGESPCSLVCFHPSGEDCPPDSSRPAGPPMRRRPTDAPFRRDNPNIKLYRPGGTAQSSVRAARESRNWAASTAAIASIKKGEAGNRLDAATWPRRARHRPVGPAAELMARNASWANSR